MNKSVLKRHMAIHRKEKLIYSTVMNVIIFVTTRGTLLIMQLRILYAKHLHEKKLIIELFTGLVLMTLL